MNEQEQRAAVIAEARRWLGTPYRHMGRLCGAGADCATFPAEVYAAAAVLGPQPIEFYPPDWHLHRDAERYLARVQELAGEVPAPGPGDLVLWRVGRAFAHGAIVIAWPKIIHASYGIGVIEDDGESPTLAFGKMKAGKRARRFFSVWSPALAPLPPSRDSATAHATARDAACAAPGPALAPLPPSHEATAHATARDAPSGAPAAPSK